MDIENVYNIVLFVIAADWLSAIVASKVFYMQFLRIVV